MGLCISSMEVEGPWKTRRKRKAEGKGMLAGLDVAQEVGKDHRRVEEHVGGLVGLRSSARAAVSITLTDLTCEVGILSTRHLKISQTTSTEIKQQD